MCLFAAGFVFLPPESAAQETRAEEIAAKQADKAKALHPFQPRRFERQLAQLESNFTDPPSGFYPEVGKIYQGGGFSLGLGYRRFYARDSLWHVRGLYSIKNYKQVEVGTQSSWKGDKPVSFEARGGWLDAPQVSYYGLGMDTASDDRTSFGVDLAYAEGTLRLKPVWFTRFEGVAAYEDYNTGEGAGKHPSIETKFDPTTAPGLFSDPTYLRTEARAAIDWRTSSGYSRKGGLYSIGFANYSDRAESYSFRRVTGEVIQHLPLVREIWVVSVRGRVQTVLGSDDVVPYFLLPQLGGGSTLRGYETGRFRDRHTLLTSAELRWIPNRLAMDMALFYDAGKVAASRSDLDFNDLKSDWGIGVRFHAPAATVLRVEMARGSEGWRLVVATSGAF